MIDKETFVKISNSDFAPFASWCVWDKWDKDDKSFKSNIGEMDWLSNPNLHKKLNNKYVFVAYNPSFGGASKNDAKTRKTDIYHNFHSGNSMHHDYNLRYALWRSKFDGSYITDLVKFKDKFGARYNESNSSKVEAFLKEKEELVEYNVSFLINELKILGDPSKMTLIALGDAAYKKLKKYKNQLRVKNIIKIYHYAIRGGFYKAFNNKADESARSMKTAPEHYKWMVQKQLEEI